MAKDSRFSVIKQSAAGKYISLKEDGDHVDDVIVPESSELVGRDTVFDNKQFRAPKPGETEGVQTKYSIDVISGGQKKTVEGSASFFKFWQKKCDKEGCSLSERMWKITRVGEKGSKQTVYIFEAVKTLPEGFGDKALAAIEGKAANNNADAAAAKLTTKAAPTKDITDDDFLAIVAGSK